MNELISIIVPVFNVEKYLMRCLDSIMKQTYENIEIIVVDDGSTDNSAKIIDNYSMKDKRIIAIHQENGGLSNARNNGLRKCNGNYVAFVDSDDYISEDYIEILYRLIKKYDVKISCCDYKIFSADIEELKQHKNKKYIEYVMDKEKYILEYLYSEGYYISAWGKLYKKELFNTIKYPEHVLYEDLNTTYKLALECDKIVCCNAKNYYYFMRADSITKENFSEKQFDMIKNTFEMTEKIKQIYPEYEKAIIYRNVHACFSTYCRLINSDDKKYSEKKKQILTYINKNKFKILFNCKVPYRDKAAIFVMIFGERNFRKIWNFYRRKKYKLGEKGK